MKSCHTDHLTTAPLRRNCRACSVAWCRERAHVTESRLIVGGKVTTLVIYPRQSVRFPDTTRQPDIA
jgi:hypothetical protein